MTLPDGRSNGSRQRERTGTRFTKKFCCQTEEHMLSDAFATLGSLEFSKFCAVLDREEERYKESQPIKQTSGKEQPQHIRRLIEKIKNALAMPPARELRAAFNELAFFIREHENKVAASPRRAQVRQILNKAVKSAERMAMVLHDNEVHSEAVATRCQTRGELERALRFAVDQWRLRQLRGYANSRKIEADVQHVLRDLEFLIETEAITRHFALFDCPISTPGAPRGPIDVGPDTGVAQIFQETRARWVPISTDLLTSEGMRRFAQGIRTRVTIQLPPHRGSHKLTSELGWLTGRQLCGVAAANLFQFFRGQMPAHNNPEAQRLCAILWRMAGLGLLPGYLGVNVHDHPHSPPKRQRDDPDDPDNDGWNDPLRLYRLPRSALLEGRLLATGVLRRNGVVGWWDTVRS